MIMLIILDFDIGLWYTCIRWLVGNHICFGKANGAWGLGGT